MCIAAKTIKYLITTYALDFNTSIILVKYDVPTNEGVEVLRYGNTILSIPEYTFHESAAYYISFHAENFLTSGERFLNYKGVSFIYNFQKNCVIFLDFNFHGKIGLVTNDKRKKRK